MHLLAQFASDTAAGHVVHDQIVHSIGFVQPCVIDGDQIWMADAARQLRFADETIDKLLISLRDTGIQNFQGEIRVDDTMPHKIYRPHAAMAKLLLDRVFLKHVSRMQQTVFRFNHLSYLFPTIKTQATAFRAWPPVRQTSAFPSKRTDHGFCLRRQCFPSAI